MNTTPTPSAKPERGSVRQVAWCTGCGDLIEKLKSGQWYHPETGKTTCFRQSYHHPETGKRESF